MDSASHIPRITRKTNPISVANCVNLLRPSDAYMRQKKIPTLLQITACRLFGVKSLPEPMLPCCLLDHKEHNSMKFCLKLLRFHWRKCPWKCFCKMAAIFSRPQCVNLYERLPIECPFHFNMNAPAYGRNPIHVLQTEIDCLVTMKRLSS